jgi:hypothetical protein
MKHEMRGALKDQRIVLATAAAIGAAIFLLVFGFQVLIPTNTDWLLVGGDLSQHYLGWEFFRNSDWTFPIGVAGDLAYPHGLAITFMDSIPLFAIPVKLFAPILPTHFQYFGLWGLFSFMAMAVIATRIVQRWTKDVVIVLATATLLCTSTVMLQRMFAHTALAGHWVLLLGIYALVWGADWRIRKNIIVWSAVLSVSALIHPYLLAMNIFVMSLSLVGRYKNIRKLAIETFVPLIATVVAIWIIGGFTVSNISGAMLGKAGYDFASPLSPNGWSLFSQVNIPIHGEAFGYYGAGSLLLILIAAICIAKNYSASLGVVEKHKGKSIAIALIFIAMMIIALSPTVRLAGVVIFEYNIPSMLEKAWAVFRVTARLTWPIYYLLVLGGIYIGLQYIRRPITVRVIAAAICLIQAIDIFGSSQIQAKHDVFINADRAKYVSPLASPYWDKLAATHQHVVYLGDLYDSKFIAIANYCVNHGLTLNTGYFARKPTKSILDTIDSARQDLIQGDIDQKTIYVYDQPFVVATGVGQERLDGYSVAIAGRG